MDRFVESVLKCLFLLIVGALLLCFTFQLVAGVLQAIWPWLEVLMVVAVGGLAMGVGMALVCRWSRRRFGSLPRTDAPLGDYRVRRPKGERWR